MHDISGEARQGRLVAKALSEIFDPEHCDVLFLAL
jgi:hypothetical protein